VISDNRFGLYSEKVHTVFITHQLFLKAHVFENFGSQLNQSYISKFNEVWVPDHDGSAGSPESLSGELSHGNFPDSYRGHQDIKYIGPQSRLKDVVTEVEKDKYDYLVLLSGPEPTRTELEKGLLKLVSLSKKRIAFVRGSPIRVSGLNLENVAVFDFPKKEELKKLILSSKKIICRSGYSTLMDMYLLEKKELILIPTPGQTEQEYLAEYWKKKFGTDYLPQNKISTFTL
jgi:hypothetical protein